VERPPSGIDAAGYAALRGQLLAARIDRIEFRMSSMKEPFSEARLQEFVEDVVKPWQAKCSVQLGALELDLASLPPSSYGALLARAAHARATLRFLRAHRAALIPDSFKKDHTIRKPYYKAIDRVSSTVGDAAIDRQLAALSIAEQGARFIIPPSDRSQAFWCSRATTARVATASVPRIDSC
jgi:hypothetical protein